MAGGPTRLSVLAAAAMSLACGARTELETESPPSSPGTAPPPNLPPCTAPSAVSVIAIGASSSLAVDEDYLYALSPTNDRVLRIPKCAGPAVEIARTADGLRLVSGADEVFWVSRHEDDQTASEYSSTLYAVGKAGGDVRTIDHIEGRLAGFGPGLAAHGTTVAYSASLDGGLSDIRIADGLAPSVVATAASEWVALADRVYYAGSANDPLRAVGLDGTGDVALMTTTVLTTPLGLFVGDGSVVLWVNEFGPEDRLRVFSVPTDGGSAAVPLLSDTLPILPGLLFAADRDWAYWAQPSSPWRIVRVSRTGGPVEQVFELDEPVQAMAVDDTALYYVTAGGVLWRAPKP